MSSSQEETAGSAAIAQPAKASSVLRRHIRRLLRWAKGILAMVGLCFILYHLAFEVKVMTSESMAPTLQGDSYEVGDWILVEKVTRWWRSPRRWEIYFYYNTDGDPVMKRAVGMPGERISIKEKRVYVNDAELDRPEAMRSIEYYAYGNLLNGREVDCGTGYFMLGDSSTDSNDSRYTGVVTKDKFRGRAWAVIWPYSRTGPVK